MRSQIIGSLLVGLFAAGCGAPPLDMEPPPDAELMTEEQAVWYCNPGDYGWVQTECDLVCSGEWGTIERTYCRNPTTGITYSGGDFPPRCDRC